MPFRPVLLIIGLVLLSLLALPLPARAFTVLCYHDVAESVIETDGNAISADSLVQHFSWLRANGFSVISIDDLLAAQRGDRPLPDRAVLLSFDDGYASFYTHVYPLLKAFDYPAVLALVGSWLDAPEDSTVIYGDKPVPRRNFMTWEQLREVASSGLVEIASHSYGLHQGIIANPQGNLEPALTSRGYDPASGEYEDDDAQLTRIRLDLVRNRDLLVNQLGVSPRVMVWPFGRYNLPALDFARELGMPVTLSSGHEEAWPLLDDTVELVLPPASRLSILPVTDLVRITIEGVRWPLTDRDVVLGSTLTLSNEVTVSPTRVSVASGKAIILAYPKV